MVISHAFHLPVGSDTSIIHTPTQRTMQLCTLVGFAGRLYHRWAFIIYAYTESDNAPSDHARPVLLLPQLDLSLIS